MQLKYFDIEKNVWKTIDLDAGSSLVSSGNGTFASVNQKPYKAYVATLTQIGTNAPVPMIYENGVGAITFNYISVGTYTATSSNLFTDDLCVIFYTKQSSGKVEILRVDDSTINITSSTNTGLSDDLIDHDSIEIRVYNSIY